jgi:hypothetical protein
MDQIARERSRSLKFVQVVFAALALLSIVAGLLVSVRGEDLGLPESSIQAIAFAFLAVGVVDTALLFLWEHIFKRMQF